MILLPPPSLRRVWILLPDDLCEGSPISLIRLQVVFQVLLELLVDPRCLRTLVFSLAWGNTEALGWLVLGMPLQRVVAREEVPAVSANEYLQRMCLCGLAMARKVIPCREIHVGAQLTFELI